jgi:hypothetical protein
VGHHQQRHAAALQIAFQPFDHINVEVVGGLVENQQLGLVDHHFGESHALHLSARQLTDGLVHIDDFQLRQCLAYAVFIVPCSGSVHLRHRFCQCVGIAACQRALIGAYGCRRLVVDR